MPDLTRLEFDPVALRHYLAMTNQAELEARDELFIDLNAVDSDEIRTDITPAELTHHCLHALEAAAHAKSNAASARPLELILSGLRNQQRNA